MNFRLTFIIVLLLSAPIVCRSTAYADAVTTRYEETGLLNRERMRWDFHCNVLATCLGFPANQAGQSLQMAWNSSLGQGLVNGEPASLFIVSTHVRGPHDIDVDPGRAF